MPSTDWPLKASTTYVQSNGTTVIGTTTAGAIFNFPLTSAFTTNNTVAWTGLTAAWGTSASNCSDWTDANAPSGAVRP